MNEDVPICHCAEYYGSHAPDCPIAAEVRALRKDRERLDWLELVGAIITTRSNAVMGCNRKMIDFVMPARGGEDGAK